MTNAPRQRGLIATDILRAFRHGDSDALAFIDSVTSLGRHHISEHSAMALLADAPDAWERSGLGMFLSWCDIHPVNVRISNRAFRILQQLPPPCGLTADDAIVAATAIEHKLPLYTLNSARFATVPGLTALQPY